MANDLSLNQLQGFFILRPSAEASRKPRSGSLSANLAVSMQIKALEQQYNVTLFAGKGRNREINRIRKEALHQLVKESSG